MKMIAAAVLHLTFGALAQAQSEPPRRTTNTLRLETPPARATLKDVAWLAGRWVGTGLGGKLEENWTPPSVGCMVATFRLIRNDRTSFFEFCLLAEEAGTLVYKVKHFHPDLRGWEKQDDYVTFRLVKVEPNALYFDGLTIRRDGPQLTQHLALKQKDGSFAETTMHFRLAPPAPAPAKAPAKAR